MTSPELFPDRATQSIGGTRNWKHPESARFFERCAETRRSALWAAYGDALGWISELTDLAGLRSRTSGAANLCRPIAWMRRVGGRAGVSMSLPQGCYSDDSQLRLAVGRTIGPHGFDVEAFAKVELPIWLSYGLGGGKSTNAAAAHLSKPRVPWFANTFKGWTNSGGNGAAMRIQPHVWAAQTPDDARTFLPDVIRNTICTHSHPIGMLGSILHALTLAHTVVTRRHPSVDDLLAATEMAASVPETIRNDTEVGNYWRAAFERESGDFGRAWAKAIDECKVAIQVVGRSTSESGGADRYADMVDRLRLRDPARRGSGMLTAVAAVGLIWCEGTPEEALRIAANAVGTDTDTIATMAGAILGVTAESEPPIEVLDADLFRSEADRLTEIACGGQPRGHRYPDLLYWSAPSRRADTLVRTRKGHLYVRGLGRAKEISEPFPSPRSDFQWQWVELESGQTLLIKRRRNLICIDEATETTSTQMSLERTSRNRDGIHDPSGVDQRASEPQPPSPDAPPQQATEAVLERLPSLDLQLALDYMVDHKDDDRILGAALRRVVNKGTRGQIAAFMAALIDELREPDTAPRPRG